MTRRQYFAAYALARAIQVTGALLAGAGIFAFGELLWMAGFRM